MKNKVTGKVASVNQSRRKGTPKVPVAEIELVPGLGVRGDAHAAPGDRQVSLLMAESIDEACAALEGRSSKPRREKNADLGPGSFAENITTRGLDLNLLQVGDELKFSGGARIRVTRRGKECPRPCAIYYQLGDCLMPRQGIFGEVLNGGVVRPGDDIEKD